MFSKYIRVKLKDLTPNKKISWSKRQLGMKDEIINDYNPRIKCILVSNDNKVCDGNHRYTILLEHYGGEHQIIVKKAIYSRGVYGVFVIIFTSILVIFGLPFYLLAKGLKKLISLIKSIKFKKKD